MLGFFKWLFLNSVDWPFKTPAYWAPHLLCQPLVHISVALPLLFISSPSIFPALISHPAPSSSWHRALTCPSRLAAAVTAGQEVKAKVERHTHRVTAMPACCVRLWMESSQFQTRRRAPDAPTPAWARPFLSRGHRRGPVLPLPPHLQVTIAIVVIAAIRADDTIIFPFCVAAL